MKVLIVGGLGYLGSIITDLLYKRQEIERVDVIDNCMFLNENIKELIKFNSFEDKITHNTLKQKHDLAIWSCNVDSFFFYVHFAQSKILSKMADQLNKLSQNIKTLNLSTWKIEMKHIKETPYSEWFLKTENIVKNNGGFNLRIPSLYGPSPRMRWDTEINSVFYNMIVDEYVGIDNDWRSRFPTCFVADMGRYIVNTLIEDVAKIKNVCSGFYNLLELSYLVKCVLKKDVVIDVETPIKPLHVEDFSLLESYQNMLSVFQNMNKQLEKGLFPDFRKDNYNNEKMIRCLFFGEKILERLRKCQD